MSEEQKRKSMNAITHRETAAHLRSFQKSGVRPPTSAPPLRGSVLQDVKRQAMSAVAHVETVAQVGVVKLTGGVAAYVGKIREADRDMQHRQRESRQPQRTTKRDGFGRDYG